MCKTYDEVLVDRYSTATMDWIMFNLVTMTCPNRLYKNIFRTAAPSLAQMSNSEIF